MTDDEPTGEKPNDEESTEPAYSIDGAREIVEEHGQKRMVVRLQVTVPPEILEEAREAQAAAEQDERIEAYDLDEYLDDRLKLEIGYWSPDVGEV